MDLDDLPEWAIQALKSAEQAHVMDAFNRAIRLLALLQRRLQLRQMRVELLGNGDVRVSTIMDAEGKSALPYAIISRDGTIEIIGNIAVPMPEDWLKQK